VSKGRHGSGHDGRVSADATAAAYDEGFAGDGELYGELTPMLRAAHERRMALLDELDVGDLSRATVVDYGVGSWGFAAVYPRLHGCAQAVGMDISAEALRRSAALPPPAGLDPGRVRYVVSRGDDLDLADDSVDVFFAGECIEHVEATEPFLDEVHRVLRPGGRFVLTTPNADALLYRIDGERYCVGPEHVALMGYAELLRYLAPAFEVEVAWGFNGSLRRDLDVDPSLDPAIATAWAAQLRDDPDLASGLVVMARPRAGYVPARQRVRHVHATDAAFERTGTWHALPLHRSMQGLAALEGDASLSARFDGSGAVLLLWCHDWSGRAWVSLDGEPAEEVDLWSPVGGFVRVVRTGLAPGPHRLTVARAGTRHPRSQGDQVIAYAVAVVEPTGSGTRTTR
jgi:SAM-dependent methyltransferase